MKLKQSLSQKLTQSLLLKPKMLQSLEMLAMPLLELETYLKQELVNNPMLELLEQKQEDETTEETPAVKEKEEVPEIDDVKEKNDSELEKTLEECEKLSEILDSWNEINFDDKSYKIKASERINFEQFLRSSEDNKEDFLYQLEKQNLPENEFDFAYELIDSTDDYGFLSKDFDLYFLASEYGISSERAEEIQKIIMRFEPCGITARNIQECLIAQLKENEHVHLVRIIQDDFDDLIHKRYKKIASKYGVTLNSVHTWKNQIGQLDPKPGLRLQSNETNYILPDVIIKKIGNEYEVLTNDFSFPKIRLSRRYRDILKQIKTDKSAVDYVRNKINSAKFIIKSIYLRSRTLDRVVKSIIRNQRDFFYNNSGVLEPLTYSVIAEELQVNESTISRVVRTKYADTPFGIMCLKDFFTSTAGKDTNYNSISRQNVETIIKRLIEYEDKRSPLSDQDITDKLRKDGINVSRRVVAKYRKAKRILNSHLRREM